MMPRLALLRHGHTEWNRQGRIQGRSDIPLDDQAVGELASYEIPPPFSAFQLVSSPLQRAVQTAETLTQSTPLPVPELVEMHWGDWEGQQGAVLKSDPQSSFRDIEDWGWDYRPPGGETPRDVLRRIQPWVDRLSTDTLAVVHIGIMRVLMAQATGWDFAGPAPFAIKRNRLYAIDLADRSATPQIIRLERRSS